MCTQFFITDTHPNPPSGLSEDLTGQTGAGFPWSACKKNHENLKVHTYNTNYVCLLRILRNTYLCKWRCRWNISSFTTLFTPLTIAITHSLLLIRLSTLGVSGEGVWWDGGVKRRRGCQREEIVKLLWSHLFRLSWNMESWLYYYYTMYNIECLIEE